ncbi:MAG: restriction endonuclease subunit S [Crinalium sp.]
MREGWEIKYLDEIATVKGGKRVQKGYKFETTPTLHPYITVADFTEDGTVCTKNLKYISNEVYEQIKNYTISSQDIYISIAGTIGKTGSVPKSLDGANLTENACKLVLHKGIDKSFIYYFTKTNNFIQQTGINTRVAAQPKLALVRLKTIKLPIPPLPEQKRIVAILDEAFEGIDRAIANTEKNLANSSELFESYLNAIFTQKGDGWVEKKLEDICKEITVGHVGSMASKYKDSGIPFLRSQNILPFRINLDNVVFIDKEFHSALKKSQLKPGDLAIVRTGYPGTAAVIPEGLEIVNCSDLVIVKPDENINPHYLCLFFNSLFGKTLVGSRLVGAAQKHFNITTAKKVLIPFPCITEQNSLVTKIDELAAETQRLESIYRQKITALNELKQSILQKAFTGELTADTSKTVKEEIAA